MTWAGVHALSNKPIIADDGYGVAGASIGHDVTWDSPANLNARKWDGVVGSRVLVSLFQSSIKREIF